MGGKYVPLEIRFWQHVDRREEDECWPWKGAKYRNGYGNIRLDRHSGNATASRIAWNLTYPENQLRAGECALHRCDNPSCCNPHHLFRGSKKENSLDMSRKGRAPGPGLRGSNHPNSLLVEDDIIPICDLRNSGWLLKDIAEKYRVSISAISGIVLGKSWCHVARKI